MADFRKQRAKEILFDSQRLFPDSTVIQSRELFPTISDRLLTQETRGNLSIIQSFQKQRMRITAKEQNQKGFISNFGKPTDFFPTLLAGMVDVFAFWHKGKEEEGFIRKLTPLECE